MKSPRDAPPPLVEESRGSILVVDDSEVTLETSCALLESRGYRVHSVNSGDQALASLSRMPDKFDLVLLDLVMPGRDGFATLREIRRDFSKEMLPVFVVTSLEDTEAITRALKLGANDFLAKPLQAGLSLAKIEAVLDLRSPSKILHDPRVGDVIEGKYMLESKIGSGGFGAVFRARHLELDTIIAIKLLQDRAFSDPRARARLRTEGRALAKLQHPNAVRVWDLVTSTTVPFMVMEYLRGRSLAEELIENGPMVPRLASRFGAQVAASLAAAHELSIIHRDVKPQNIFLAKTRDGLIVKLLDFGLAAMAEEAQLTRNPTREGELIGSPRYLAPETILGEGQGPLADIYSLGIVLFEMLSGRFPYRLESESLADMLRAHTTGTLTPLRGLDLFIPAELESFLSRMLEREPASRPAAFEVQQMLSDFARPWSSDQESMDRVHGAAGRPDTEPVSLSELDLDGDPS